MRLAHWLGEGMALDCQAAAQHFQLRLPALRLWISIFFWNLMRGEMLKGSEKPDCKSPACLAVMIWGHDAASASPSASPCGRCPSCAVRCSVMPSWAMTYPVQGGQNPPCSQPCQEGKGHTVLNPAHLLLHTEILQEKKEEGRSTVNPISIAANPVGKYLVCSSRSPGKARDFFLKGKWVIQHSWRQPASFAWWWWWWGTI